MYKVFYDFHEPQRPNIIPPMFQSIFHIAAYSFLSLPSSRIIKRSVMQQLCKHSRMDGSPLQEKEEEKISYSEASRYGRVRTRGNFPLFLHEPLLFRSFTFFLLSLFPVSRVLNNTLRI